MMDAVISCIILLACFLTLSYGFMPEIQMPYKAISGTSTTEINKIGSTLTCDEQRNSLKDCATECFSRSLTSTGCPGFYTNTTQSNICHLCHASNLAEIKGKSYTIFGSDDKLFLLKDRVIPEVSMDFDNYTGDTINGVNVVGTAYSVVASDHVAGIKGEGLYIYDGGKVYLAGSGTECWTNLEHCPEGITASIWVNIQSMDAKGTIIGSGSTFQRGFTLIDTPHRYVRFQVYIAGKQFDARSNKLVTNQWYLLTGTYDPKTNVAKIYVNGADYTSINQVENSTETEIDWGAHLGIQDRTSGNDLEYDGYVDEFKYYYRVLNSAEIWREYVGYDIDLDLSPILSPDLVSNGNDNNYAELVDGNLATCVSLTETTCTMAMKVKLWNSSSGKTNYTVTVVTENLECHHRGFMMYGEQDVPESLSGKYAEEKLQFMGNKKMITLSDVSENNGQNECVFRHICVDMCYYVFISVENVADDGSWKICEVQFN